MSILILMLCGAEHLIFVVESVVSARAFCSKPFREDLNWIVPIKLLKKGSFVCKHNIFVKFIRWPIWDRGTYFEWVPCKTSPCLLEYCMNMQKRVDALQFFKGLKSESKWKTVEGKGTGAHSLAHNTLRGRGACWSSGMGTRKSWQTSLTHTSLHTTHTRWLVHSSNTFGARTSHGQHEHIRLTTARPWGKPPPSPL